MNLILSTSSPIPLYEQLEKQLRQSILTGELVPGQALPSIRNLASTLSTSVITIKRAYDDLEAEGYLFTTQGKGTFVALTLRQNLWETQQDQLKNALIELLREFRAAGVDKLEVCRMIQEWDL